MSEEELIETLKEFEKNRVEQLKEPSRNLFYAIMKIADERDKYKIILDKIKEYCEYNDDSLYTFEPDYDYEENIVDKYEPSNFREDILELLEEIE